MIEPDRRTSDVENDPIYEAAAEWVVRLQNPSVSLEETLAWQTWMKESHQHAEAFARVEEVSQLVRQARAPGERTASELRRDTYDGSVSLTEWSTHCSPRSQLIGRVDRRRFSLALAASVALVVIGLVAWQRFALQPAASEVTSVGTAVGENRTVLLEDGSKVVLGGDTQLEVAMSKDTRSIELSRGEALFTVAKDRSRPFKVHAGDATVIAVGTEFNVRRASDRAFVSVVEGRVVVEPSARLVPGFVLREFEPKLRPVHVDAGQQTTAGSAGIELASAIDDPGAITSWQSGRLAFRLQPLRYVLEDVNRYAHKPVVLDDDSIGDLVITGTVTSDNVGGWVMSLERAFALTAVEEPDRIVLHRR
jgi:transmembrane sensor